MGNASKKVAAAFSHRVASFPPFSKNGPPVPPDGSGSSKKRSIPKEHAFDPRSLKPMAKALWATSVSLGHALAAYRYLTRLKSATVSPDGQLGGRGYVMGMAELRQKLYESCESLSAISDTLHDEINAPHWKPRLAQLDENDAEDVSRFIEESQEVLQNPEEEAEEEIQAIEKENDGPGSKGSKDSEDEGGDDSEDEEPGSELPGGGNSEESKAKPVSQFKKEASNLDAHEQGRYTTYLRQRVAKMHALREANSSVPVDSLSGPRVNHLGPAEGQGPFGSFNWAEDATSDDWGLTDGRPPADEYDYTSEWENEAVKTAAADPLATSTMPDGSFDDAPTQGWDYGLGHGDGGDGSGILERSTLGPKSGVPGDAPTGDVVDSAPVVDVLLNERHAVSGALFPAPKATALLPNDNEEPVARSDYFEGPKGNLVQACMGGCSCHQAESQLPGSPQAPATLDWGTPDVGERVEDTNTPYVRYDYTTHTTREP